jgi:RNA polymerase subunit RPABC4/transcription elongation factor Spt4
MARRTRSDLARYGATAWILLSTPALLLISLPVYLLARPQATVAQRRSRDLVVALSPELFGAVRCEACGQIVVDEDWRRCPACASWLQVACVDCGRWSATNLELCPWCATSRVDEWADVEGEDVEGADADATEVAAAYALQPDGIAAAYALQPDDVDDDREARPATAPLPVFSILHEMPVLAGTPGPRDSHRGGRRGRGFEVAVDETPAAIGR